MDEQILKILIQYINDRKIFDYKAIVKIIGICLAKSRSGHYCLNVQAILNDEQQSTSIMAYSSECRKITIYFENLMKYLELLVPHTNKNEFFYKNCYILSSIFHELEHVIQEKTINEKDNSFLAELFCCEKNIGKKSSYQEYKSFYPFNPRERSAEILAVKKLIDFLELFNLNDSFISKNKRYLATLEADNYKFENGIITSPTQIFFKLSHSYNMWSALNKKYSLDKKNSYLSFAYRTTFGLPISLEEYRELQKRTLNLKSQ